MSHDRPAEPVGSGEQEGPETQAVEPWILRFRSFLLTARRVAASCDESLQHEPSNAVSQQPRVEVHQEPDPFVHDAEIRE